MDINSAYALHRDNPTPETLSSLLTLCRSYALALAYSFHLRDAEDAASEAVASAWRCLDKYQPSRSKFSTWFHSIAKHRLLEEFRHIDRANKLELCEDAIGQIESVTEVDAEAVVNVVLRLIPNDSTERRLADLILSGHTIKAAARQIGLSESSARKKLRRLSATLN
jgi:RNA polymerase sigma factor (sigma-70 family)